MNDDEKSRKSYDESLSNYKEDEKHNIDEKMNSKQSEGLPKYCKYLVNRKLFEDSPNIVK